MLERLSKRVVEDLEDIKELVREFEYDVKEQSGIVAILEELIKKYKGELK